MVNIAQPFLRLEPTLLLIPQKETFMGSCSFREMPCVICRKPLSLHIELCADENGKAVHCDCYIKRIISARLAKAWTGSFCLSSSASTLREQQMLQLQTS
jgi:hypothetical protein